MEEKNFVYSEFALPSRPNFGSLGQEIQLSSNLYELKSYPEGILYQYHVDITPEPKKNRMVFDELLKTHQAKSPVLKNTLLCYDGKNLVYTSKKLPVDKDELKFVVEVEGALGSRGGRKPPKRGASAAVAATSKSDRFTVRLKLASEINMMMLSEYLNSNSKEYPSDAIHALEVVMRQTPTLRLTSVGRGFFDGKTVRSIMDGCDLWLGYQQVLKPATNKIFVNIDMSSTAFRTPSPVLELFKLAGFKIEDFERRSAKDLDPKLKYKFDRKIRGVEVEVGYLKEKRKYKVNGLIAQSARDHVFESDDEKMSVEQYFSSRHGIKLAYPRIPLLHVGSKNKTIYIPIELCSICAGQRLPKLNPKQTSDMIKQLAKFRPAERKQFVNDGAKLLHPDIKTDEYALEYKLEMSYEPTAVSGRILSAPKITYHNSKTVTPEDGSWNIDNNGFLSPATISRWAVLVLDIERFMPSRDVEDFIKLIVNLGKDSGVMIKDPKPIVKFAGLGFPADTRKISAAITSITNDAMKKYNAELDILVVIMPQTGEKVYAEIKRICDTQVDVLTQCLQSETVKRKRNPQVIKNILLKLNAKLGGLNSGIESSESVKFLLSKPAIIFGADVTHPAPGSNLPSIAAVVASMDAKASKFAAVTQPQDNRKEIITDLKKMARTLLVNFYKKTGGKKPERILFYRDGVGEGQFSSVIQHEVAALKEACRSLDANYDPPITFVIVQKRHHVRFFPTSNSRKECDKSGNVRAGTVVDRGVTSPSGFDFYLCSHGGIQGTSRPCHYQVIYDENGFDADTLEDLTYRLCYTYVRCTRSVSYVPAAYYAHWAAFRARCHVAGDLYNDDVASYGPSRGGTKEVHFDQVKEKISNSMYFV